MCESADSCSTTPTTKDFILSLPRPVVFQGMIEEWDVLKWRIEDWSSIVGEKPLPVRCGDKKCSPTPLWEYKCPVQEMTIDDFSGLECDPGLEKNVNKWYYFDYKYLKDWAREDTSLESLSWQKFGFPEINAKESTLWIGSKGSHTPCHYDTYGCNLVAQVFGRKRWILFPPSESNSLKPTRIPYEESSVYSQWNLSCPPPEKFYSEIKDVYIVDLKPGDVLFVPQHWWHYVESLDLSVAINTWLPTGLDDMCRLSEALVQLVVSSFSKDLSEEERLKILNPNEWSVTSIELQDSMYTISALIKKLKDVEKDKSTSSQMSHSEIPQTKSVSPMKALQDMNGILVPCCSIDKLKQVLSEKCNCPSPESHDTVMSVNASLSDVEKLLNAFCHADVIDIVSRQITETL